MDTSSDPTLALFISETPEEMKHANAKYQIPPGKCLMPEMFLSQIERIRNFKVRPDDIWIITYPKCGTTWTQEMVWLIMNDFDFEKAKKSFLYERSVFLEFHAIGGIIPHDPEDSITKAEKMPSPRVLKSHLPTYLLPRDLFKINPKVIYVYRNPKDVAISFFHHYKAWMSYFGSQNHFIQAFLEDKVLCSPFWNHVLDFWAKKDEPNVLFNTYEDMKRDLQSVAMRTAEFLNREIPKSVMGKFLEHLSFESMKGNRSVNYESILEPKNKEIVFMRNGQSGDWKTALTQEQIAQFDKWTTCQIRGTAFPHYN